MDPSVLQRNHAKQQKTAGKSSTSTNQSSAYQLQSNSDFNQMSDAIKKNQMA
jgi:hypothetical protein